MSSAISKRAAYLLSVTNDECMYKRKVRGPVGVVNSRWAPDRPDLHSAAVFQRHLYKMWTWELGYKLQNVMQNWQNKTTGSGENIRCDDRRCPVPTAQSRMRN